MKSKKVTALLLAGAMVFSLASCSNSGKRSRDDDETERVTEEETTEETTTEKETTTEEETTTTESETTAETTEESRAEYTGTIIDFDDMHFFINGKKYTMGKTTLQEMYDDGVPFRKSEDSKLDQKLKKNSSQLTGGFSIELDEYWAAQVFVMNVSSEEKPASECVIYRIILNNISRKYQNNANLTFDFPLNLTTSELVKIAGEPADGVKHLDGSNYYTDTYTYKQKSKKYLGSKSYTFEYLNDVLNKVTIDYLP